MSSCSHQLHGLGSVLCDSASRGPGNGPADARCRPAAAAARPPSAGPSFADAGRPRSPAGSGARRPVSGRAGSRGRCDVTPNSANAPSIPASTPPTPPGSGIRLANMPTKNALDDDRNRDVDVEGLERRPEDPDLRRPEPDRPGEREPAARRVADERDRPPGADRDRRRRGREPPGHPAPEMSPARPRRTGARGRRAPAPCSRKMMITPPAKAAGTMVRPGGAGRSKTPVESRMPLMTRVTM